MTNTESFSALLSDMTVQEILDAVEMSGEETREKLLQALSPKAKQAPKLSDQTLCGIPLADLTPDQKALYTKYKDDRQAMEKLQNIIHNPEKGQFEFLEAKLALADQDLIQSATKAQADAAVRDDWRLPRDVDYTQETQCQLNPELSDYDAMIMCMPGDSDADKIENFRLLIGMNGRYRTSQSYSKSNSWFVARRFFKDARNGNRDLVDSPHICHGRPVRPL